MSRRAVLVAVVLVVLLGITAHSQEIASVTGAEGAASASPAVAIVGVASPSTGTRVAIPRFEIGTQSTMLRVPVADATCGGCGAHQFAFGPALRVNLNRYFAIDAAASFSPTASPPGRYYGGSLGEALVGVNAAIHSSRWTLFSKARPGILTWSQALQQIELPGGPAVAGQDVRASFGRSTYFALDLGGGLEYRLTSRVALRAEMGELFIRLTPGYNSTPATFVHHLQAGTGVYYRLGKTVATEVIANAPPHRFFDRTNVVLMTLGMLAQASDAITTQRAFADCHRLFAAARVPAGGCAQIETDPIARPFVSRGWGGQLGLGALVNTAQTLAMYGIHRMGHHRIERMVPIPLTIASGYLAYSNRQQK